MNKMPASRCKHLGFTLVELMVALVISLILIAGITRMFMANRETYSVQAASARVQENARFVLDQLRADLSMAGFPDPAAVPLFNFAATNATSLAIQIRPIPGVPVTDCHGRDSGGFIITNTYSRGAPDGTDQTSLFCTGTFNASSVAAPLADGIQALTFEYGIDTDDDREAEQYVAIPAAAQSIVSVRITLQASDPDQGINRTYVTTVPLRNAL
jgi:type IV pilus assembly protein PilW